MARELSIYLKKKELKDKFSIDEGPTKQFAVFHIQ